MSFEESLFFQEHPNYVPIYLAFIEQLEKCFDTYKVKVCKTQISFSNRYVFAMVSLPQRRIKSWPKEYMMISFGLPFELKHPRIVQAVEAYPCRWTHHVLITKIEEIDEEIMKFIKEAYEFSLHK